MYPSIPAWALASFALAAALVSALANAGVGSLDEVYDECGKTAGCFGSKGYRGCNNKCLAGRDCDGLVAFRGSEDGARVDFTLVGRVGEDLKYVAVGISADGKMGHDGVVECVHDGGNVSIYRSFNFEPSAGNQRLDEEDQNVIADKYGVYEDGAIKCAFSLPATFSAEAVDFRLNASSYHVLIAVGTASKDNVGYHDVAFAASRKAVDLFRPVVLDCPKDKTLLYVHGVSMVLAWIFFASNGIVVARYLKKTWTGHRVFDGDVWFRIHQGFMATAWALTVIGVLCIFAYEKWEWESEPHTFVGIAAAGSCFVQPLVAFLRPGPAASKRVVFNRVHSFLGVSAHVLAVTNIFLAFGMKSIVFPTQSYTITWIFVGIYAIVHVILQVQKSLTSDKGESMESAALTTDGDAKTDANGSGLRQTTWIVFLLASAIVTVLLSTLIVEKLRLESHE